MNREVIAEMYKKYNLRPEDVFKHKHYLIITRSGIEKIAKQDKISVKLTSIVCSEGYCCVKAEAKSGLDLMSNPTGLREVETFGSAKHGGKVQNEKGKWVEIGNTSSWYVMEVAEKRAKARAILMLVGMYELGVMSEDECEDFKRNE